MVDASVNYAKKPAFGGKPNKNGRPRGKPNQITADVKAMILGALADVGGQAYLARQAEENPTAFLSLLGKVLPKHITADVDVRNYVAEIPAQLPTEQWLKARDEWLTAIAPLSGLPSTARRLSS